MTLSTSGADGVMVILVVSSIFEPDFVLHLPGSDLTSGLDLAKVLMPAVPLKLVGGTASVPHGLKPYSSNFLPNHVAWPRYT